MFKDFIMERFNRQFEFQTSDHEPFIRPNIQKMDTPMPRAEGDGYFTFVRSIRKIADEMDGKETKLIEGIAQDNNFYVYPFKSLYTIPGSSTVHSIPSKLKDLKNPIDKEALNMAKELVIRAMKKVDQHSKVKIKKKSRSGLFFINDTKILDKHKLQYTDNTISNNGYKYIVRDHYDIDHKMQLLEVISKADTKPLYTFSFRKDTPDKVDESYNAKVREYTIFDGDGTKVISVDPNTEYGPLMRTRTVTAGSISDNSRLLRKSNLIIEAMQLYHPWQQSNLMKELHEAHWVINMDVSNFDYSDTVQYRDALVEILELQGYYKEFQEYELLAWTLDEDLKKVTSKVIPLVSLKNGTVTGHQIFTTCLNWFIPLTDVVKSLRDLNGWNLERIENWLLDARSEGFSWSSCGDDNSFIGIIPDTYDMCKNISEYMVSDGSITWSIEYGSTLGLLRSKDGTVENDISKNFVKSLMTPYLFESKLKPFRAYGYKIKYENAHYRPLIELLFKYFPKLRDEIYNAKPPAPDIQGLTMHDIEHADWDPRSKLYKVLYSDVEYSDIPNML